MEREFVNPSAFEQRYGWYRIVVIYRTKRQFLRPGCVSINRTVQIGWRNEISSRGLRASPANEILASSV
jgi:hypothetical protein